MKFKDPRLLETVYMLCQRVVTYLLKGKCMVLGVEGIGMNALRYGENPGGLIKHPRKTHLAIEHST
jgi:hypothetical protein